MVVVSGSMKGVPSEGDVRKAFLAGLPNRKLFSKEQQSLFAEHAPDGIRLDDLVMLGGHRATRRRSAAVSGPSG